MSLESLILNVILETFLGKIDTQFKKLSCLEKCLFKAVFLSYISYFAQEPS